MTLTNLLSAAHKRSAKPGVIKAKRNPCTRASAKPAPLLRISSRPLPVRVSGVRRGQIKPVSTGAVVTALKTTARRTQVTFHGTTFALPSVRPSTRHTQPSAHRDSAAEVRAAPVAEADASCRTKRPPPSPARGKPTSAAIEPVKRKRPTMAELRDHSLLTEYNRVYQNLDSSQVDPTYGKRNSMPTNTDVFLALQRIYGTKYPPPAPAWHADLPTRATLQMGPMGKPSKDHSSTQTATCETCLYNILTSGYLDYYSFMSLASTNPKIQHMERMIVRYRDYDFRWLREEDPNWKSQKEIPRAHVRLV